MEFCILKFPGYALAARLMVQLTFMVVTLFDRNETRSMRVLQVP